MFAVLRMEDVSMFRNERRLAAAVCGLLIAGFFSGCGKQDAPPEPAKLVVPGIAPGGQKQVTTASLQERLHQSFEDATFPETPEDQRLPDLTKTGKSVGKLYMATKAEWDKIRFLTPDGKKITYTATITTDLGAVTLDLWPEAAPNHVRSFIALSRVGYYDGLAFD